jgi:hypothetical protein
MRAYITSKLERLGTLEKLDEEMPGSSDGNGWESSKIVESRLRIVPQPLDRLTRKAIRLGILKRAVEFFRSASTVSRLAGSPTLVYFPLWYVKGNHECFYLRETNYQIRVEKDVVAVEVDGETRDLMIEEQETSLIPEAFKRTLKRFSRFLSGERRYFNLSHVTELAVRQKEAELYVTWDGRHGTTLEEVLPRTWRTQRVFDVAHLNIEGLSARIALSRETKETVLKRFQEELVKMPENSKHVLSNSFQIHELAQYYVPYVHFPVTRRGRLDHMIINGANAEIADAKVIAFAMHQLSLDT